jgi:hypothetical protein
MSLVGSTDLHRRAWYLLGLVSNPYLIGTWLLDKNQPTMPNELNGQHRQPVIETDVGAVATQWNTDHFMIVPLSEMRVKINSYANWLDTQVVYTITAIIKIKLINLPSTGFINILRLIGRRSVGLGIKSNGELVFTHKNTGGWANYYETSVNLTTNTDHFVRFTFSRSDVTLETAGFVL